MAYLKPTDTSATKTPIDTFIQKAFKVANWFKEEFLELTFGEVEGRPSASYVMRRDYLARFLENGWTVDAVISSTEEGEWKSVTDTDQVSNDLTNSSTHGSSGSFSKSSTKSESKDTTDSTRTDNQESSSKNDSSQFNDSSNTSRSTTDSGNSSHKSSSGSGSESSSGSSNSTTTSNQNATNNTENHGTSSSSNSDHDVTHSERTTKSSSSSEDNRSETSNSSTTSDKSGSTHSTGNSVAAYWAAYQRIRLRRRRLVPEYVLQSMIDNFTDSYNTGKTADKTRYDQIVALYATTLANTEKEMEVIVTGGIKLDALYDTISASYAKTIAEAQTAANEVNRYDLAAALDEIKRTFDAQLSKAKSELIASGLFNGTVWISVSAGIERQRESAIVGARAEAGKAALSAQSAVATIKNTAYSQMLSAMQSMAEIEDKRRISATEMRNNVVKLMVEVIASRKEDAPQLESFAQLVNTFGFSVGASGNVL